MNTNDAADLRLKWRLRNPVPLCMHVRLELELNEAGYMTGNYICLVCGHVAAKRQHHEGQPTIDPVLNLSPPAVWNLTPGCETGRGTGVSPADPPSSSP
jgi:hypothetical protein